MNLYRVFIMISVFLQVTSFKTIINTKFNNKLNFGLFAKKNKAANSYLYTPKTINQAKYVNYLNDEGNKIIISTGPAGTGKTLLACQKAIMQMKSEEIDKIIITRPIVTIEEDIGFLPGNINKKMDPWTKPIFDIFLEYYSKTEVDMLLNNGKIEICPLVFMRGRTFKNSFIIADEMQNSSPNQMKMLVTRIGLNSRMVITGDLNQIDIKKENGLYDFVNKIERYNNTELIKIMTFDSKDIERSEIVKQVIEIYAHKPYTVAILPNNNNNVMIAANNTILTNNTITTNNTIVTNNTITTNNTTKTISKQMDYGIFNKFVSNKNSSVDNDAALIPKKHMTRKAHISYNHDIFFEPRDF
jgi:phosphate starvation-inducible PhoH-like protein